MPKCPKCASELVKRKSTRSYNCKRHGFVRKLLTPKTTYLMPETVQEKPC